MITLEEWESKKERFVYAVQSSLSPIFKLAIKRCYFAINCKGKELLIARMWYEGVAEEFRLEDCFWVEEEAKAKYPNKEIDTEHAY